MVITGFNDNDNMMLVIKLVEIFVVNFAMNKMRFRVEWTIRVREGRVFDRSQPCFFN